MSLPGSSASSTNGDAATQSRIRKGKGRAINEASRTNGHQESESQDYDEALRAALSDEEPLEAGETGGQGQDDDATFIYNGLDDEDTQDFIRDASLKHKSYQERLRGVLEGDENEAPDSDDAVQKASRLTDVLVQDATATPPQAHRNGSATPTSPSIRSEGDFSMSQTSGSPLRQPRQRYLPPRRPPMNPLISRLRSTSGMSTLSPSTSFRSISHSSSVNSLRDVEGLNGFANSSPNSSFLLESGRNRMQDGLDSRSSVGGALMSPERRSVQARSEAGETEAGELKVPDNASLPGSQGRPSIAKPSAPIVDPFRWTALRRISQMLHPQPAKASVVGGKLGEITAMAASGIICAGTSAGWAMVFDYNQALKCICGNEEIAKSAGKVTSIALSSDQTFVAVGHETGFIYLYALAKPQIPARVVPPVSLQAVQQGKAEGHLAASRGTQSAILQLGFVGSRHTAIVSADTNGLAFYHSLGKVLGLANTDVLRILGRHPQDLASTNSEASPILAMQALPLGTQPHATDEYCLVVILTPAKIVVAGLKPSAKTWWRALNTKHSVTKIANGHQAPGTHGALAWLPSIDGRDPCLAYTWDDALHIVRVEHEVKKIPRESKLPDQKGTKEVISRSLRFVSLSKPVKTTDVNDKEAPEYLTASGNVLALQWYNHRSLACMSRGVIEVFDTAKASRIERAALNRPELQLASEIPAQQAMRIYRSKVFLMCKQNLQVGSLLSWTDRILILVDRGELLQAIELALAFYDGTALSSDGSPAVHNAILGLPTDAEQRKAIVGPRLQGVLAASVDYVFSEDRMRDDTHFDATGQHRGVDRTSLFETLVDVTVRAGLAIDDLSFLFEDLYERYTAEGIVGIFLDRLEPFIMQDLVRNPPIVVTQQMLQRHEERDQASEAEALIWHIEPSCLDVDQVVGLCTRHGLFDALIYAYTKALADYVGPFVALFHVLRQAYLGRGSSDDYFGDGDGFSDERTHTTAYKLYSYVADTLVGLSHPNKEPLSEDQALHAKRTLSSFLFSGLVRSYPDGSGDTVRTVEGSEAEPTYPYLRLLLAFDAEAMLGCLDVALEDPYLNEEASGHTPDRQQIMLILLDVMRSSNEGTHLPYFTNEDRTFLNIFVAHNLPKYTQFIQLAEPTLKSILLELIQDEDISTGEDRQLAAEFLLSAYTPVYDDALLDALEAAHFYRVLSSVYKSRKAWRKLAAIQIRDAQGDSAVFGTLQATLADIPDDGKREIADAVLSEAANLSVMAPCDLAIFIDRNFPIEHDAVLEALAFSPQVQREYLGALLEPQSDLVPASQHLDNAQKLRYVALLCEQEPQRVVAFLATNVAIPEAELLATLREKEAYDAVIWLQAHKGDVEGSLATTSTILEERMELLSAKALTASAAFAMPVQQAVNVTRVAITICCKQEKRRLPAGQAEENWFILLSSVLRTVDAATAIINALGTPRATEELEPIFELTAEILAALTTSSSSGQLPFSRLVRRLMDESKSNTYVQYKDIIHGMLGTYRFEHDLLRGCNALTAADVYEHVVDIEAERRKGWRPNVTGVCEACGKPVWAQADPAEASYSANLIVKSSSGLEVSERLKGRPSVRRRPSLKGKEPSWIEEGPPQTSKSNQGKSVVVFRGGAICHAACLE